MEFESKLAFHGTEAAEVIHGTVEQQLHNISYDKCATLVIAQP